MAAFFMSNYLIPFIMNVYNYLLKKKNLEN